MKGRVYFLGLTTLLVLILKPNLSGKVGIFHTIVDYPELLK